MELDSSKQIIFKLMDSVSIEINDSTINTKPIYHKKLNNLL